MNFGGTIYFIAGFKLYIRLRWLPVVVLWLQVQGQKRGRGKNVISERK